jgi:hypothetical protein
MGSSAQNSSVVHWCRRRVRFNEVPEKVPEVRGFVQSQVRFNRLPEKVPEREALVQSRVKFNRVPDKVPEKVLEKVLEKVPGSLGPWALVQSQVRFNRFWSRFQRLAFAARFRKICKNKTLRLLGIPPKLMFLKDRFFRFYAALHALPFMFFTQCRLMIS